MNSVAQRLLIALGIAIFVFFVIDYLGSDEFRLPTGTGILQLVIIFLGNFAAMSLAGGPAATTASTGGARAAPADAGGKETGTVKWFNVKKGYGFITRDQGDDVFVHYRNIEGDGRRAIADGQRVAFIVVDSDKGLQAEQVVGL